jgi:hypothetical protein
MTRLTLAAVGAILLTGPALSEEVPDQNYAALLVVRAQLLATPVWTFEWTRPGGKVQSGKAWFLEKDGKLIGNIDAGLECDSEVTLRADGFDLDTCFDGDKRRFVRSGQEFKATAAGYLYAIRPTR